MRKLFRVTTVPISVEKLLGNQLTFMNQYFEVTAISSDHGTLEKIGKKLGIRTHAIEMTRKITPFRDLQSLWQMYRYFKKENPDIVHTHTPKAGLIGMLAARLAGIPVRLHTVAGLPLMEASGATRQLLNIIEKITYAAATKVYPNSWGLYHFILKEKFCDGGKLKVIGNGSTNGIDLKYFDPALFSAAQNTALKKALSIADSDFVFIFVGRLVRDKGINELVSAFSQIKNDSNIKLLLVGAYEDDLDPLFSETLAEIQNNPNILHVGFKQDVRPYFAISHCLVFPSYREGFPNVVMQAGAMLLPSIVSDINGSNEIIEEGQNGLIIPVKDTTALKMAMEKIIADRKLYVKLKSATRAILQEKYSQEFIFEKMLDEYMTFKGHFNI